MSACIRVEVLIRIKNSRDVGRSEILGGHALVAIQGPKFWGAQQYYFSTKLPKSGGGTCPPGPPSSYGPVDNADGRKMMGIKNFLQKPKLYCVVRKKRELVK